MSETLYRKYRPQNFSEVIGQRHIVRTLSNALKRNRVGHAYLFTGPRGTGKTTIARLFAKAVNCISLSGAESCRKCDLCKNIEQGRSLDIIEIDAASNTGVDNIRELRETVKLPPTQAKYKVYIIDEVHMLSTGAFNALLKTLEEPPAHVIFILATTEIHKVPETIISRCQRFDFARLPIQNIIEKLSLIAQSEKIKIEKDALEMIAIAAEGGMRDAESLLAQVISLEDKNITGKEVEEILGATDRQSAHDLAEMIISGDSTAAIAKINGLLNDGYDLQVFNKSLINYLRQLMLLKISPELKSYFSYEITGEQMAKMLEQAGKAELAKIISAINLFLEAQNKISGFLLPQLPLEIAIIKATNTFPSLAQAPNFNLQPADSRSEKNNEPKNHKSQITNHKQISNPDGQNLKDPASPGNSNAAIEQFGDLTIGAANDKWRELLEKIAPLNHSLKALLSNCKVFAVNGDEVILATPYDFYMEKLNEPANQLTVADIFGKILGAKIRIKTISDKTSFENKNGQNPPAGKKPAGKQNSLLASAMKVMGGKIVKE